VLLGVLGVVLVGRSTLLLAGRGRPRRGLRPAFVLAGPYLVVRNPQFAGIVITTVGVALAAHSWALLAGSVLVWAGAHLWVVRVEEPKLGRRFGSAYEAYLRRVPRWLPGWPGPRRGHER